MQGLMRNPILWLHAKPVMHQRGTLKATMQVPFTYVHCFLLVSLSPLAAGAACVHQR
jgi:hypothetical protein